MWCLTIKIWIVDRNMLQWILWNCVWMQWADLFSDIGGIAGLYIGFSVLTVFEFVDLLIDVLVAAVASKLQSDQPKDHAASATRSLRMSNDGLSRSPSESAAYARDTGEQTSWVHLGNDFSLVPMGGERLHWSSSKLSSAWTKFNDGLGLLWR